MWLADLQIDISPIRGFALYLPVEQVLTTTREAVGVRDPEVFIDGEYSNKLIL